jgi:two-component system phosphate regulon sensor histidine kinase PhoR
MECSLRVNIEPGLLLLGDNVRLREVLVGFLANSVTHGKGPLLEVQLKKYNSKTITLMFKDQGKGIATDKLGRIFNHFLDRKTPESQTIPNEGMSLYLCKAIIEHHKGYIDVQSALNEGTVFTIFLPAIDDVI